MSRGGTLATRLEGHESVVFAVAFDPLGEFLISQSWDYSIGLWSLASRSLVFKMPGCLFPVSFSNDGHRLGAYVAGRTVRLLEVERATECRVLAANAGKRDYNGAFSPDGRWVVIGGDGFQCWNVHTGQRVWAEPGGSVRYITFRPDGGAVLTTDETGAREWPWSVDVATGAPRLGTPRRLPCGPSSQMEFSGDGSVLVMSEREGLRVFNQHVDASTLLPMVMCNFAAVSPDGRWAAAAPWGRWETRLWELPVGREMFWLTNGNRAVAFSRDGRWLVMVKGDSYECFEVGTWRCVARIPRERPESLFGFCLSSDSRWIAVEQRDLRRILLCDLPTLRPWLTLDAASEAPVAFSPDASLLLTRRSGGQFALWDLRKVREKLTSLGLGW
jgi:WD40 repeat protein